LSAASPIGLLPRVTLSGQIASLMREAVLSGAFAPGSQMNEADLAARFGVSRGPVREALQRLIQEGLLVAQPHRGVFVAELTEADLADVFFVRDAVEGAALRRVMAAADRELVERHLMAEVDRMKVAVADADWASAAQADFAFHRTLIEAAGSPRLSRLYDTIQAETKLCLHLLMAGYRSSAGMVEEHRRLARLVGSGTPGDALAELMRHLGDPIRILRRIGASSIAEHSEPA
jgi:DNA-binding GntR family transcriptional regulator